MHRGILADDHLQDIGSDMAEGDLRSTLEIT